MSAPRFQGGRETPGGYLTSKSGALWFGSPVPDIAGALLKGIAGRRDIRWGAALLGVKGVALEPPPDFSSGEAVLSTMTPVLVKLDDRYIFPEHPRYAEVLVRNLAHKADVLGLPNQVDVEVLSAGSRRKFLVQRAPRHGCTIKARVSAAPALLDALYDWGLGVYTNQGFGWIR